MMFSRARYDAIVILAAVLIVSVLQAIAGVTDSNRAPAPFRRQVDSIPAQHDDTMPSQSKATNSLQKAVQQQTKQTKSSAFGTNTNQNPETNANASCSSLDERIAWSQASREERLAFVQAQHCLTQKAGIWTGDHHQSHSVHEDFVLLHSAVYPSIHGAAALLPAHRLFVKTYFNQMQRQCGYTGRALYFDFWTYADQGTVYTTTDFWSDDYYGVFDSRNSNGGTFGLFQDYRVRYVTENQYYDQFHYVNRPLQRHFKSTISNSTQPYFPYLKSDFVRQLLAVNNYNGFRYGLEKTVHQYMHGFYGGDALPSTSTNTPFFWQIHLAVDALWSAWQEVNGGSNRFLYGGPRSDNSEAAVTDTCVMLGTWSKNYNVEDMLDTRTKPNCYKVSPFHPF